MSSLNTIPEILAVDSRDSLIRIPGEQDVPVTPRIRKLIDSRPFRRLASISQTGLVSLVYPGARHSRFEHSLGVYRMSLLFLKRLATIQRFRDLVTTRHAEMMIVAALLHDTGHWPYCHPIQDMGLPEIPSHESLARERLANSNIPDILHQHFDFSFNDVSDLLDGKGTSNQSQILQSILSGPIDVDKMDYLYRDSLHAGVPYGMHYDRGRLIGSLCLNEAGSSLAITDKGCTAAELMVFARYVMFSEVYWHHTVRSATAMLQRAFFVLRDQLDLQEIFQSTDPGFHRVLVEAAKGTLAESLLSGLFGEQRRLYKRLAQFTFIEHGPLFARISRRPWSWLVRCAENFTQLVNRYANSSLKPADVLIDAPPQGLEVQFRISVLGRDGEYRQMDDVSPVVKTLAQDQFDNYVKRVRVFVRPGFPELKYGDPEFADLLHEAIDQTEVNDPE